MTKKQEWRTRTRGTKSQVGTHYPLEPHGNKSSLPKNLQKVATEGSAGKTIKAMREYSIKFKYSNKKQETLKVIAGDPDDALNKAMKIRKHKNLRPVSVTMHNSVGEFIGKIIGGAVKAGKQGYQAYQLKMSEYKAWEQKRLDDLIARARKGDLSAQIYLNRTYPNVGWERV
jgi:hypothetical protein